jgi:hypothetical protein
MKRSSRCSLCSAAGVVIRFGNGLRPHRRAGFDAEDLDFVEQHRPELAGKAPPDYVGQSLSP